MSVLPFSFFLGFAFAIILTPVVACIARRRGVVDAPDDRRKLHAKPTPLLGGVAVFGSFALAMVVIALWTGAPFAGRISPPELGAVFFGGLILVIGGALDDRYGLRPRIQFLFPLFAAGAAAAAGIGISRVTNPFGSAPFLLVPWITVAFTVAWLLGTTYTTKLLDGLDGLVAGVTAIGALLIAVLSLTAKYYQPDVAVLALVLGGVCLGFLVFNFHPARIFLGEGGSTLCGFLLGVLAVISGGKIATALLVLGIPAADVSFVVVSRLINSGKLFTADRRHLHFQLLRLGLSHRGAVLFFYGTAAGFGALTLVLQSFQKLIALAALAVLVVALSGFATWRFSKKNPRL